MSPSDASDSTGHATSRGRWRRVAVGLGSNLGDREESLRRAVLAIGRHVLAPCASPLVVSEPQGCPSGSPTFLNAVTVGLSRHDPDDLLAVLKALEHRTGRRVAQRNAPRILDCDLLICGALEVSRDELTLPHPRLTERPFWTAPLVLVAPDLPLPDDRRVADLGAGQGVEWRTWSRASRQAFDDAGILVAATPRRAIPSAGGRPRDRRS